MTTRELFEFASMDALGLLDDDERQAFENAFRAAPPHVQAEIRREQLREANATDLLPNISPPASLRARVIAAVMGKAELLNTEPIATIGPATRTLASTTAFWRAACIGFATATVVLAGFVYTVSEENKKIGQEALNADAVETMKAFGNPTSLAKMITSPHTIDVAFRTPATPNDANTNSRAGARLYFDPETQNAYLLCQGLPIATTEYTLVVGNAASGDARLESFRVSGSLTGLPLESFKPEMLGDLEIRSPGQNGVSEILLEGGDI